MWVILPVKSFQQSKQRLAEVLTLGQRQRLSEAMLKDTLMAISKAKAVKHILVVTKDNNIAAISERFDCEVLIEPDHCCDLNEAVTLGVHHAQIHGAEKALVLHADLPLTTTEDIDFLARDHLEGGVTIVPDKFEKGTNGMLFDLPADIVFSYGQDSYELHVEQVRSKGMVCTMAELPDLTLDIDSPEDLQELNRRIEHRPSLATSQLLKRPEMQESIEQIVVS